MESNQVLARWNQVGLELVKGAELELVMGEMPNKDWGR